MRVLHGSGAGVTDIFGDALPQGEWDDVRGNASRLLRARGREDAAAFLLKYPFLLRSGSNYFGDEFAVLLAHLDLETYVAIEVEGRAARAYSREIADTLSEIGPFTRFVAVELASADPQTTVSPPSPRITSQTVARALADAEQLIRTNGPASAVDRVHTALHGYLRVVLDRTGIPHPRDGSITRLYRILREQHPALKAISERTEEVGKIVMIMAAAVDAVNILRNNRSVAHPNAELLEEPEAALAINAVRTLLHYLDSRVGTDEAT